MLDRIAENRIYKDRDRFIESITENDICDLASSYHNNDPYSLFKPPVRGSYNICFFVRFQPHCSVQRIINNKEEQEGGDAWVVRVPLSPCLAFGANEKLESEIATMELIAEKTTIPIPRIYAYSLARDKGPFNITSFVILEYIDGRKLSDFKLKNLSDNQRNNFYKQLANIYIQLRRLEFTSIGMLSRGPGGVDIDVRKQLVSISINEQELEGLQSSHILKQYGCREGVLKSSRDYVSMLLYLARNAFEKGRKSVYDEEDGNETLYHLHQFFQFVEEKWLNSIHDSGPFVLVHGDLNPYNLMVNENFDIMALLDWEWSGTVPLRHFMPPPWLTDRETDALAWPPLYSQYVEELNRFHIVVREQELEIYGEELLAKDWAKVHEHRGILIQVALENWTDMEYFAARYLDKILYDRKDLQGRIKEFMTKDPARQTLVARKIRDRRAYREERKRLEIKDPADDEIEDETKTENTAPMAERDNHTFITHFLTSWLKRKRGIPSRIGPVFSQFALGSGTIMILAGTSYIIWKCIMRSPMSH